MSKLSEGDRFKVHGYVDVAGLVDGHEYRVISREKDGSRHIYHVRDLETGDEYRVNRSELEPYIGSKTYVEQLNQFFGGLSGYISVF